MLAISIEKAPSQNLEGLSDEAVQLARDYDDLDTVSQKAVKSLAAVERTRTVEPVQLRPRVRVIPLLGTSFAAGPGEPESDMDANAYTVPEDSPAAFAIRVTGDSAEPYIHDGSIALCEARDPYDGEVAALLLDGDFLVKQVCLDYAGTLHLFSLNRARADMDRHIPRDDIARQIQVFGTVIMDRVPMPEP